VLYNVSGQWTKSFEIHEGPAKGNSKSNLIETYDPAQTPATALTVAPIEEQHPLESRRAWSRVAAGIAKGDLDAVGVEKTKIENAQREKRAAERAEGTTWPRRYFSLAPDDGSPDAVLAALGATVGVPEHGDADKTGGLWRFDKAKADEVKARPALSADELAAIAKELLGQ